MRDPKRILVLPFFFLPEAWNGIDEHLLLLSGRLNRSKHQLAVLCQAHDGPQTQTLAERAGIELINAPYEPDTPGPERCRRLRRLLKGERFSVLHMHSPVAGGQFWPALAARMAGVKTAVTYHQVQPWRMPLKTRVLNRVTHSQLVDKTIAVSRAVQKTLQGNAGLIASQIEVIPNAIELTPQLREARLENQFVPAVLREPQHDGDQKPLTLRLSKGLRLLNGGLSQFPDRLSDKAGEGLPNAPAGATRLGYFGRLSPEKGLSVLLRALALVPAGRPAQLYLAGDGPQREELVSLARSLEIEERVTFLGFRNDARDLMTRMDVIVHVPEYEGFGLVMLEAMAAGKPLIVNDAPGGMTDLVTDGVNGLVVPAGSPERLAAAIESLTSDKSLRNQLGVNGFKICSERYAAPVFGERMGRLYDSLFDPSIDPVANGAGRQPDTVPATRGPARVGSPPPETNS
jgi:glycosyltransferase involved in cell wall biosynthesis